MGGWVGERQIAHSNAFEPPFPLSNTPSYTPHLIQTTHLPYHSNHPPTYSLTFRRTRETATTTPYVAIPTTRGKMGGWVGGWFGPVCWGLGGWMSRWVGGWVGGWGLPWKEEEEVDW